MINIEAELSKLKESQNNTNKTKACLFNLIIYAEDKSQIESFENIIQNFIEKYPSRIIFIQSDNSKQDYLKIDVSNRQSQKNTNVTCDQINIKVSGQQIEAVPFIILPHFVPDLPIYLLWGQNPTKINGIFSHVKHFADRIIFDFKNSDNFYKSSSKILEQINILKIDVLDANWARMAGWRYVLFLIFYNQEKINQLQSASSIKICYNQLKETGSDCLAQTLYLQAWLATQLKWTFVSKNENNSGLQIIYKHNENYITFDLVPVTYTSMTYGEIISIHITTLEQQFFEIDRHPKFDQVTIHVSRKDTCDLPFVLSLPTLNSTTRFMKEIFFFESGDYYKNTLRTLALMN